MQLANIFSQSVENLEGTASALIDRRAANIQWNRAVLESVAAEFLFCAKQCIAVCGDSKNINISGNPGNYLLSFLKWIAKYNVTLNNYLQAPEVKCVTYMSPQTQNELLDIMAKFINLCRVIKEIKQAQALQYHGRLSDTP